MIAFDAETKALDTDIVSQHNITDLICDITFIVSISQEKPLQCKGIHTHTQHINSAAHV